MAAPSKGKPADVQVTVEHGTNKEQPRNVLKPAKTEDVVMGVKREQR